MSPSNNLHAVTTNLFAWLLLTSLLVLAHSGGVVDTGGVVAEEGVEGFVESEAGGDGAVRHDLSLHRLHVRLRLGRLGGGLLRCRGSSVRGAAGADGADGLGVEDHVGGVAILGRVGPELGRPVHGSAASVVADVARALGAAIVEGVAALAAARALVGRAAGVARDAVLRLLAAAGQGAVRLHELPRVAGASAVAGAVRLAAAEQRLRRERGGVVDGGVGEELAAGPDAVAVGQRPRHGEGPLRMRRCVGAQSGAGGSWGRRETTRVGNAAGEGGTADSRSCRTRLGRGRCRRSQRRGTANQSWPCVDGRAPERQ
eukprot:COSAG06_NODE_4363_length_4329_cov_64.791962_2_plen_315_part_00